MSSKVLCLCALSATVAPVFVGYLSPPSPLDQANEGESVVLGRWRWKGVSGGFGSAGRGVRVAKQHGQVSLILRFASVVTAAGQQSCDM